MDFDIQTWVNAAAYIGAGIAMGFGAIGAAIGEGYTAAQANSAISQNSKVAGDIIKTMLVGQAIAESASIFALVVAIILLFTKFTAVSYVTVCALLGAGLSMGLGAIGSVMVGPAIPSHHRHRRLANQPGLSGRRLVYVLPSHPTIRLLVRSTPTAEGRWWQRPRRSPAARRSPR